MTKQTYIVTYENPYYFEGSDCSQELTCQVTGFTKKDVAVSFNDKMLVKYPSLLENPKVIKIEAYNE